MVNKPTNPEVPAESPKISHMTRKDESVAEVTDSIHDKVEKVGEEKPKGFESYTKLGGTLTQTEYKIVWDTPASSKKHRQYVESIGIANQIEGIIASSILTALSKDTRIQDDQWLKNEARIFVQANREKND